MNAHRPGPVSESPTTGMGVDTSTEPWRDPSLPVPERVADLLSRMTINEKLAQLSSVWLSGPAEGNGVAPMQGEFTDDMPPFGELIADGLGQLTRVFGTKPMPPAKAMAELASLQDQIMSASRFGIPAIAHEECLTGFATWTATAFPTPLAWGAAFHPELVEEMATAISRSMKAVGVHQGLGPVLDIARDARWGRVEETIGEDPYLVGRIASAYVRGFQSTGLIATLKHFAGYSGSRAGRNLAPVPIGPREFADVFLPPFEMAIREAGARSVMHSYADIDGVPAAAHRELLTRILRDEFGFTGMVVADYYGISFLETLHGVAGSPGEAAALALEAGVDVELPNVRCYGAPLAAAITSGRVPEELLDRAAGRVLWQKFELGLLDPGWDNPAVHAGNGSGEIDLNPPAHHALARQLAEESVVLLANPAGVLPLAADRIAVIGPLANDPLAFFGCYTFPRHVGHAYPGTPAGVSVTTLLDALRAELPHTQVDYARGCGVQDTDPSGLAGAAEAASAADVVVAVLGDEAGLFGRGTSGEGCDAGELRLPGIQQELLAELIATGKPVVLVLVTGRPYAIGPDASRLAGIVQAFFPGQEGGTAIAGVLTGRVVPSGKLPMEMPSSAGSQPSSYLHAPLAGPSDVSSIDPTPLFAFGHGLSYTTFGYSDLVIHPVGPVDAISAAALAGDGLGTPGDPALADPVLADPVLTDPVLTDPVPIRTSGAADVTCVVRNTGDRAGGEVVQLYLSDPVAQVVRPVHWLAGFARVWLEPGQACQVTFRVHADRTAFHGLSGARVVEPGLIGVSIGSSSASLPLRGSVELHGPVREVGSDRVLSTPVTVSSGIPAASASQAAAG